MSGIKIKILEHGSGLLNGDPFPAVGDVVDLPAGLAVSLVNDGRAAPVAVDADRTPEAAAAAAPEKRGPGRPRKTA